MRRYFNRDGKEVQENLIFAYDSVETENKNKEVVV